MTDDKIAKAVERLLRLGPWLKHAGKGFTLDTTHANSELAAVFVAAAEYRKAFRAYANEVTVDDGTFELKRCEELREACNSAERELDAALQRAAEKVMQ